MSSQGTFKAEKRVFAYAKFTLFCLKAPGRFSTCSSPYIVAVIFVQISTNFFQRPIAANLDKPSKRPRACCRQHMDPSPWRVVRCAPPTRYRAHSKLKNASLHIMLTLIYPTRSTRFRPALINRQSKPNQGSLPKRLPYVIQDT